MYPYATTPSSQEDMGSELDNCRECIDNIKINHEGCDGLMCQNKSSEDVGDLRTYSSVCCMSGISYYSRSIPRTSAMPSSHRLGRRSSKTKCVSKCGDNLETSSPHSAQTCVEAFYTPVDRSLPPIFCMPHFDPHKKDCSGAEMDYQTNDTGKLRPRTRSKNCEQVNDNGFHFPKIGGIELPNGFIPWDAELNDSDCDDGMFDREEVEDMNLESDQITGSQKQEKEIVPSYATDEQAQSVLMDAFIQNNRLDSVSQMMAPHKDYLRIFLDTQSFLLREDGPLSYEYRNYIAIMASARHHCSYLVQLHEQDFLLHNGDPAWLKGIEHTPRKLQDLCELNKLLAHQPWLVTKEHMTKLLKSPEPWSLSELMHAIILLTHFHALSSFVLGCGINSEVDVLPTGTSVVSSSSLSQSASSEVTATKTTYTTTQNGACKLNTSSSTTISESSVSNGNSNSTLTVNGYIHNSSNGSVYDSANGTGSRSRSSRNSQSDVLGLTGEESGIDVEALMEKMKQLTEAEDEQTSQEELLKRFHSVEKNTAEIAVPNTKKALLKKSEMMKYIQDEDFCYIDFAARTCIEEFPTFRACDYSWEDHGFSLANRLYADIGNYLDAKYSMAASLTYYTMGDLREVDTSSFRRAIWNYIHTIYGIRHDDYNYQEVNQLLAINLKAYIKTAVCYPERLQKKAFDGVMKGFKHSEKVHVNLMLMEARQQAELLYALRALNRYLT